MWCFWVSGSFEKAALRALNLGHDADTTAAVCGKVAGACYGQEPIPARWLKPLATLETILTLAGALYRSYEGRQPHRRPSRRAEGVRESDVRSPGPAPLHLAAPATEAPERHGPLPRCSPSLPLVTFPRRQAAPASDPMSLPGVCAII
ncbi:ADP-ribosylglycohydrolase family protein [Geochorda subterranea]|uniref:ADP-ribosylglycohydrolase family protein n=1 Tax=Geochorda subterranea TaxID=3109564 RepID=A0ABZ1BT91_9FIRM|nr:ADP-ribosylglycohydrolase family protein [Limnochorda sp. LNt]WRP15959.1 ADP-ribosylglycohydrolase family protein [Limnochorda sp. LNt]